jgi:hypothetical protein
VPCAGCAAEAEALGDKHHESQPTGNEVKAAGELKVNSDTSVERRRENETCGNWISAELQQQSLLHPQCTHRKAVTETCGSVSRLQSIHSISLPQPPYCPTPHFPFKALIKHQSERVSCLPARPAVLGRALSHCLLRIRSRPGARLRWGSPPATPPRLPRLPPLPV